VRRFPNFVVKYTHSRAQVNWQFMYKREALLPLGGERKVRDPVAIRLLYHEVRRVAARQRTRDTNNMTDPEAVAHAAVNWCRHGATS